MAWLLVLFSCTPPPQPPASEQLRIAVDPSAAPLLQQLAAQYRVDHSYVSVQVSERGPEGALGAIVEGAADLALIERNLEPAEALDAATWKAGLRAWSIGRGALAVVVHPSNPVQGLSRAGLQAALSGAARNWSDLGGEDRTVKLVTRETTAPSRALLEQQVLQGATLAGSAVVMPSDQAVAEYVAAHPEAVGCLAAPWASADVKAIAVDDALPNPAAVAAGRYALIYPLLLVTPSAVSSKAKGFIDYCLGPEGQAVVGRAYVPLR